MFLLALDLTKNLAHGSNIPANLQLHDSMHVRQHLGKNQVIQGVPNPDIMQRSDIAGRTAKQIGNMFFVFLTVSDQINDYRILPHCSLVGQYLELFFFTKCTFFRPHYRYCSS